MTLYPLNVAQSRPLRSFRYAFQPSRRPILSAAFLYKDKAVTCSSPQGTVAVWNVKTEEVMQVLDHPGEHATWKMVEEGLIIDTIHYRRPLCKLSYSQLTDGMFKRHRCSLILRPSGLGEESSSLRPGVQKAKSGLSLFGSQTLVRTIYLGVCRRIEKQKQKQNRIISCNRLHDVVDSFFA